MGKIKTVKLTQAQRAALGKVPYGWQFTGEDVFMPTSKGAGLNCFALLSRTNDLLFDTTRRRITSEFIIEQLERLSFSIKKITVVVLDNARVHTSHFVQERRGYWQRRGLYILNLLRNKA